ncbi:MAG: hypothetical protein ACJATF_004188, partial [Flavobacteriales bacterium]
RMGCWIEVSVLYMELLLHADLGMTPPESFALQT